MNRDDAVWYYRLGGQTLGPVTWPDIEELTRDTVEAAHLLVARGGDRQWKSAAQVLEEFPGLAKEAAEPQAEPEVAPSEPAGAEAPAVVPAAAPPVSAVAPGVGGAFTPVHGLGQWIGQAWEMVIREIWAWIGGFLLVMLVSALTLGLTSPPLMAGLYMMALKRYRGEQIGPGDVFQGFSRFLESWGLTIITAIPALLLMAPMMILVAIPMMQAQTGASMEDMVTGVAVGVQLLMPVLWLVVMAIQTIFFYSWVLVADGHGAWKSVTTSWEKVSKNYWSYLGMWLVLSIIASLGSYACYVGILVSYPLLPCAQVAAYMWHFRTEPGAAA